MRMAHGLCVTAALPIYMRAKEGGARRRHTYTHTHHHNLPKQCLPGTTSRAPRRQQETVVPGVVDVGSSLNEEDWEDIDAKDVSLRGGALRGGPGLAWGTELLGHLAW